ncbi:MAG: serine hydroxymethyltransferase, partial [Pseudomonadota bacterium]
LSPKGVKGNAAEKALGRAYITCNKNGIPNDPEKFTVTSGIRVGSPAGTTRGFGPAEFREVGQLMAEVLDALVESPKGNAEVEASVRERVKALTAKFPIYDSVSA